MTTTHSLFTTAVAEMVASLGYEPFIWDAEIFGRQYTLIRIDPLGLLIDVKDSHIMVGVEYVGCGYTGGIKLDLANPKTTEKRLGEIIDNQSRPY